MRSAFLCLLLSTPVLADASTFAARRRAALEKAPDGIVLLHANSGFKRWEEAGFLQDPAFLYFTGLRNAQAAILALDGPAKATWLFVRPPFRVGAEPRGLDAIFVKPGAEAEAELKIDHVVPWDELIPWLEERRKKPGKLVLYADDGGQTGAQMGDGGNPPGLAPAFNSYLVFSSSLKARVPDTEVRPAFALLDEIRQIKSADEIATLRKAAKITADGFWAAARVIAPGRTSVTSRARCCGPASPRARPASRSGPGSVPGRWPRAACSSRPSRTGTISTAR
jgi:Xaa-Pro aminopeptidase